MSQYLTRPDQVRTLGCRLGIPEDRIELALDENSCHMNEAGLQVLRVFRAGVSTGEDAHRLLEEALVRVGMRRVAVKVLGWQQ